MPGMRTSLDSLPNDVQQMIFSYLTKPLSGYALDGMPRNNNIYHQLEPLRPSIKEILLTHPFQNLAKTCKLLRAAVEGYCNHLLKRHGQMMGITKIPELDEENWEQLAIKNCKRKSTKAHRQTYRNLWLRKSHEHCFWCGRKSKRRAIFDLLVYCCHECDEKNYGKRLSKTEVMSKYKIKPLHYLYPSHVFTDSGFKPLSTAMRSISGGVEATYFLEEEVKKLAEYARVHDPNRLRYKHAIKIYGPHGEKIQDTKRDEDDIKSVRFWDTERRLTTSSYLAKNNIPAFIGSKPLDLEDDESETSGDLALSYEEAVFYMTHHSRFSFNSELDSDY